MCVVRLGNQQSMCFRMRIIPRFAEITGIFKSRPDQYVHFFITVCEGRFVKNRKLSVHTGLLVLCQLFVSSNSFATDYYVHPAAGSNTNSGRHPDDAFADLKQAMKSLQPGDTLYLRSGTYREVPVLSSAKYRSGTASQPITIRPYRDELAKLSMDQSLSIKDLSWWIFEDLLFENSDKIDLGHRDSSILPSTNQCTSYATDITIRRNRFQHGSYNGITITCARRVRIEDNLFDNLRSRIRGKDKHGISFQYFASDFVISGNIFSDIGADGIHFLEDEGARFKDILISNNEFMVIHPYEYRDTRGKVIPESTRPFDSVGENAIDVKQGPGPIEITDNVFHGYRPTLPGQDASGATGVSVTIQNNASGITLARNHFYDNVRHVVIQKGSESSSGLPSRNVVVRHNVFEDVLEPGGIYEDYTLRVTALRVSSVRNVQILNNTFQQPTADQNALLYLTDVRDVAVMNNVFRSGIVLTQYELPGNKTGSFAVTANNNAWSDVHGIINVNLLGINDVTASNLSMNWSAWRPREGSPLIDAGYPGNFTEDFYGDNVSGLAPDIGAVEYQTGSDSQSPTVSIRKPFTASVSGVVNIEVDAADDNAVSRVKVFVDGAKLGVDREEPYMFSWDSSAYAGKKVTLKAVAIDEAGNRTSDTVKVTVTN